MDAQEIIETIKGYYSDGDETFTYKKGMDILEDAEALEAMGLDDDDIEAVEEAHDILRQAEKKEMDDAIARLFSVARGCQIDDLVKRKLWCHGASVSPHRIWVEKRADEDSRLLTVEEINELVNSIESDVSK